MIWQWRSFSELSRDELYEIMVIRQKVFVAEQKIACVDADGVDRVCWHLFAKSLDSGSKDSVVAYARILPPGVRYPEVAIGRVATTLEARGQGMGRALMLEALKRIRAEYGGTVVHISAQAYLEKFYKSLQFKVVGNPYIEEEIPHLHMVYDPTNPLE